MAQWTLTLVNRGVRADTVAKPDTLTHALIERGTKHECPLVTLEQRIMQAQAPPLEELDTVGRERHIWFTDGSSMVIHGKKRIRYAAINLEEEVLTGYLDQGSAQHAELHAIYQVLKQYAAEKCPKTVYIYADSNYCVNGVQYWMFDWQKNGWKAADGKEIAYIEEWKWIYAWVTSHPDQLKVKHVKAHGKGSAAETIWNNRADAIARDYEGIAAVTRRQEQKVLGSVHLPGRTERQELVNIAHQFMHERVEGMLGRLKQVAEWRGMRDDIETWVRNCVQCSRDKAQSPYQPQLLHQRRLGPWHRIQIDFIDKLPRSKEGFRYLLVIIDSFSGWVEAFPTRDNSARIAAKKLFSEVVCRYGTPEIIDSDNGGSFVGNIFTLMLKALGVSHKLHVPYRPQSSGQVERMNSTIKEALRKVVDRTGKDWPEKLPLILAAIRSSNRLRTKIQPYQILFGRQ
ncbi:unnamed protein product [Caretta caretta]